MFPAPSQTTATRIADATERAASELALKRLGKEANQISAQISREASISECRSTGIYDSKISLLLAEQSEKKYATQTRLFRAVEIRDGVARFTFLAPFFIWIFDNLWSFGAWARGWDALAIGLVALSAMQIIVMTLRARHRNLMELPFPIVLRPPRIPTETEISLQIQFERINAEIGRHRQVVGSLSRRD